MNPLIFQPFKGFVTKNFNPNFQHLSIDIFTARHRSYLRLHISPPNSLLYYRLLLKID